MGSMAFGICCGTLSSGHDHHPLELSAPVIAKGDLHRTGLFSCLSLEVFTGYALPQGFIDSY